MMIKARVHQIMMHPRFVLLNMDSYFFIVKCREARR